MTDVILQKIENKFGANNKKAMQNLILSEEFDSEAIMDDIKQMKHRQSNILNVLSYNKRIAYFMNKFVENTKCMSLILSMF